MREVQEETGFTVSVKKLVHTKFNGDIQYFEVEIESGGPKIQDPDGLIYEISWVSFEMLQELPLTYEEDRDFLSRLLESGWTTA
ncbi:NUDIX hydrolase [Alicyclobacillus fastidiosus]|uniref:NUDIX hydrolase n=1 Tax=Alicyclobacillus fastidiosus TaxID=392011 RepID=A0ABV5AKR4_9BACL|nr:NUDIX hydrolase [Alicyclobacillus fastidiosus]WEH08444.1 NUDIX hydrolase [Alicyclobacillus fastidiosus]